MKKYVVVCIILTMILSLAATPALATHATSGDEAIDAGDIVNNEPGSVDDPDSGDGEDNTYDSDFSEEELEKVLTQDSPWYFLKRFIEKVRLTLTFNSDNKAELMAELAEERAMEFEALESKYADEEISEEQLDLLEDALDDCLLYTEQYLEFIMDDEAENEEIDEEDENEEVDDEDQNEEVDDDENEEVDDEDENEEVDDEDENEEVDDEDENEEVDEGTQAEGDKYQQRIAHLQRIAEKAPEAAQKGLARAIANAQRQRERMMEKGKLTDDAEIDFDYYGFKLEVTAEDNELKIEYKEEDELVVKVEFEQEDGREIELEGIAALEYLLPILEDLNLDASMSDEDIITALLAAFGWDGPYDEIKVKVEFKDDTVIEIEFQGDEETLEPVTDLPFHSFELEIETDNNELEVEFNQKENELVVKVELEQEDGEDIELEGAKALDYLLPILEGLNLNATMSEEEIVNAVLAAFGWDEPYDKVKVKVQFLDGTKIELEQEGEESSPDVTINLPYKKFELEIESDDNKLEVEFKQERDKFEAEMEFEQEDGREIELEGARALEYLLPILEGINLNATMSEEEIVNAVLVAFGWDEPYDKVKVKVLFLDGTKIELEHEVEESAPDVTINLPYKKFELEIESDDNKLEVEFKQERDKFEAEMEFEQEDGREIELEGARALEYLLPILEDLNLTASMSDEDIINALLAAFDWNEPWEELKVKIEFTDGTKIDIEIEED